MKTHRIRRVQRLERPRAEVFEFFEDATNLALITPPFLGFEILTPPPIRMHAGTLIDYRIRLFGAPLRWRTEIEVYERGVRFVDRQLHGPYRIWRHTHLFRDVGGGTEMVDEVDYAIGLGPVGALARSLFVERTLERIFDYRAEIVGELFRASSDAVVS
jgi:ligand-binding SRPBCC domain-containing protein